MPKLTILTGILVFGILPFLLACTAASPATEPAPNEGSIDGSAGFGPTSQPSGATQDSSPGEPISSSNPDPTAPSLPVPADTAHATPAPATRCAVITPVPTAPPPNETPVPAKKQVYFAAVFIAPQGMAVGTDGTIFVIDSFYKETGVVPRIIKLGPDGTIADGFGGGPTLKDIKEGIAILAGRIGADVGSDGSLFIADPAQNVILRVYPNGEVVILAGTGESRHSKDGAVATQASLVNPSGVAVSQDGTVYFTEKSAYSEGTRRIQSDGRIATMAKETRSFDIEFGPDGNLYLKAGRLIRRVAADGTVSQFGGEVPSKYGIIDIAIAPNGDVLAAGELDSRVYRTNASGSVKLVAGTGEKGYSGDGGPATQAQLGTIDSIAVGPDGSLYIIHDSVVRRVSPGGIISTITGSPLPEPTPTPPPPKSPAEISQMMCQALVMAWDSEKLYPTDQEGAYKIFVAADEIINEVRKEFRNSNFEYESLLVVSKECREWAYGPLSREDLVNLENEMKERATEFRNASNFGPFNDWFGTLLGDCRGVKPESERTSDAAIRAAATPTLPPIVECRPLVGYDATVPPFDDDKFRQALAHALGDALSRRTRSFRFERTQVEQRPTFSKEGQLILEPLSYEPDRARRLVGESEYHDLDAVKRITFHTPDYPGLEGHDNPFFSTALSTRKLWLDIFPELSINVKSYPPEVFREGLKNGSYPVFVLLDC